MDIAPAVTTLAVIFIAIFIRSIFGFGESLLAIPLLTFVIGVQVASPLMALVATTAGFIMLLESWSDADFKSAWRLILSSFVGIPVGLLALNFAPEMVIKYILATVLVLFGLYRLSLPNLPTLHGERLAYVFGFVGGILGGLYNTNGPPIVLYGTLRRWPPKSFRATLQGYFLPTSFLILGGHALSGLWTREVIHLYLYSLPIIYFAIFTGNRLNGKIKPERFESLLSLALIVLGILLVI